MKTKWLYKLSFAALNLAMVVMLHAQGTAFTYQGRLSQGGSPANGTYDFRFRLASDPLGNNYVGGSVVSNALPVSGGFFTVTLDFGAGVLTGSNYWLEVDVKTNGAGGYNTLAPLQSLTPSPYAIFANSAGTAGTAGSLSGILPSGQLAGTYSSAVSLNNASNSFTGGFNGNGSNVTNVNAATLGGFGANQFWRTTGNSNTVAGIHYLGTVDNQPLELSVNSQRALRLEPNTNGAPNMIGGATNNFVDAGIIGATIAGGGAANYSDNVSFFNASNHVSASFGTISGGRANTVDARYCVIGGGGGNAIQSNATYSVVLGGIYNTIQAGSFQSAIGGGYFNTIQTNAPYSAIGGGTFNTVETNAPYSTIGGGSGNLIEANAYAATISGGEYNGGSGRDATVGGGYANLSAGNAAAVGGGVNNSVYGYAATIPGGYQNVAVGQYSFAAGQNARVNHDGSFVWSDGSSLAGFASTGINEFDVRAYGGVNFVTGGAGVTLDGQTVATANALTNLSAASITSGTLADARLSANMALRTGGNAFTGQQTVAGGSLGIGTLSPVKLLQVGDSTVPLSEGMIHLGSRSVSGSSLRDWELGVPQTGDVVTGEGYSFVVRDTTASANARLIIKWGTGNVGIGTSTPGFTLDVNGNAHRADNSANWTIASDRRLKRDINRLTDGLATLARLNPVCFRYTDDYLREHPGCTDKERFGIVAQEFQEVFPDYVTKDKDGILSVDVSPVTFYNTAAIRELNQKLEFTLAAQKKAAESKDGAIQKLEQSNQDLRRRLDRLECMMSDRVGGN